MYRPHEVLSALAASGGSDRSPLKITTRESRSVNRSGAPQTRRNIIWLLTGGEDCAVASRAPWSGAFDSARG